MERNKQKSARLYSLFVDERKLVGQSKFKFQNYLLVTIPAHHQGWYKYEYPPDPDHIEPSIK